MVFEVMGSAVIAMEMEVAREKRRAKTLGHSSMRTLGRGRGACKGERKG